MSDLHTLLKLSEDADETAVLNAVKALAESKKEAPEGTVTLAQFMTLSEEVAEAKQENKDLLRDMYLADAVRSGRVAPAELVADKGEPALITIFNASPDAAKAMIEARPINKMLHEFGKAEETTVSGEKKLAADDIWSKNQSGGREGLDLRARQLMSEDKTLNYGDALIEAEREAVA